MKLLKDIDWKHIDWRILKRLDWYIVRKFLGTFFFSIILILSIGIVFDLTEKMDDFYEYQLTAKQVILNYYIYFIPYYANMFAPLFIFISVIFFTSKLAGNSEIIAMMATGMSFRRLMWPYLFSAIVLLQQPGVFHQQPPAVHEQRGQAERGDAAGRPGTGDQERTAGDPEPGAAAEGDRRPDPGQG